MSAIGKRQATFRLRTPNQFASYHAHLSAQSWEFITESSSPAEAFGAFYTFINAVFDLYFPLKSITIKDKDPPFLTPVIKYLLRKRNKLLKQNRVEVASALSKRINNLITRRNTLTFERFKRGSRELWAEVNRLRGAGRGKTLISDCSVTATSLNQHFGFISTDKHYSAPLIKSTVVDSTKMFVDEFTTYKLLASTRRTATGPDGLPFWFLEAGASALAEPVAYLYNISINFSYVPSQWKVSTITPVPKISHPSEATDFRPISVTPILCRLLEKFIVHRFFYEILLEPQLNQDFMDQYAFRPTGSTSAALIALTDNLTDLLRDNKFVHLIALDFTKAFDTVRHSYLAEQLAELQIPDCLYNWIIDYLSDRGHETKYNGLISAILKINASIVQGSGLGPANFITAISKLKAAHHGNRLMKYADDTYLLVPSSNSATVANELDHVSQWAETCNLKLNKKKIFEMVIRRSRGRTRHDIVPDVTPGLTRVSSLNVLGVTFTEVLNFEPHITRICCKARQSMYALRILVAHGLRGPQLYDVVRATTVARLLYAAPAWWGFAGQQDRCRLQSVISKLIRLRYLPDDFPTFERLCLEADSGLFSAVLMNQGHLLHSLLPPKKPQQYALRPRSHDHCVPLADNLRRKTFIVRMLYSY